MPEAAKWFAQAFGDLKAGEICIVEINSNGYTYVRSVTMADISKEHPFRTDIPMNDMLAVVDGVKGE